MDLFLSSTNPENTFFFSANGVAHYQVVTAKHTTAGPGVTTILRPAANLEDATVAEIEWKDCKTPTIIRSPLLSEEGQCMGSVGVGVKALRYLYRRSRFSPSRFFIGDDARKYQWKIIKGIGCKLILCDKDVEVASSSWSIVEEGVFAGERKHLLRIQPCSIDIDLVVLTFVIMEKKRRERDGYVDVPHDQVVYQKAPGNRGSGEEDVEEGMIGEL